MVKNRNRAGKNRKKKSKYGPLGPLVIVALLIVGSLFLLEKIRVSETPKTTERPPATERHKLPPRVAEPQEHQEHQTYTSAAVPAPVKKAIRRTGGSGTVAIIVDDMGTSVDEAKKLMAIKVPLTFSIIPGLQRARQVAVAVHEKGYQVMIHIPMEPQGYPQRRMEKNGLLTTQDDGEITKRLKTFLDSTPYAVGANNHMGSLFTEDKEKMRVVLTFLKERGLFFIDSKTTPHSVGYSLAHSLGEETAARNVFLDNVQKVGAIDVQLAQLVKIARKKGSAIAICHPHKATIAALSEALPALEKDGIRFVAVSDLVK